MPPSHISFGIKSEELACRYLSERNFRILDRNWRRPWGELDIVALKGNTLHFVEVKGERVRSRGFEAFRRANKTKLHKVIRTAKTWLASNGRASESPWQIDVISVTVDSSVDLAHITHFKNVTA